MSDKTSKRDSFIDRLLRRSEDYPDNNSRTISYQRQIDSAKEEMEERKRQIRESLTSREDNDGDEPR